MARKSILERELKRAQVCNRFKAKRSALLKEMQAAYARNEIPEERVLAAFQKLPRDASPVRQCKRCQLCGRVHGVLAMFRLCRICFRKEGMQGNIPGLLKASW